MLFQGSVEMITAPVLHLTLLAKSHDPPSKPGLRESAPSSASAY